MRLTFLVCVKQLLKAPYRSEPGSTVSNSHLFYKLYGNWIQVEFYSFFRQIWRACFFCCSVAKSCPTLAWTAAHQAPLSFTISWSLLKLMSIDSVPARLLCPWNSPGKNTGVGSHSLLQRIFLTQGSNPGILHCRWILYHLSHQGSPPRATRCKAPDWTLGELSSSLQTGSWQVLSSLLLSALLLTSTPAPRKFSLDQARDTGGLYHPSCLC